jgi:chromosome segregation ATPase
MLKHQTAQNIIEIGKRLIEAKEMLPHGEWGKWLEEKVEFTQQTANKFMRVANEMGNYASMLNSGTGKLFALLSLPEQDRERFIETQPIEDMTTRELQQAIREKKELEKQLQEIKSRPPKVEYREVEKIPDDYHDLRKKANKLQKQLLDKDHELESARAEKQLLERKAKLNDSEAKKYKELKDQIEKLSKQKNDLGRQVKARTELSGLVVRVEHLLKTELAPIKYSRAIEEAKDDDIVINNLSDIVARVKAWCKEMENIIEPEGEIYYIESEVIR